MTDFSVLGLSTDRAQLTDSCGQYLGLLSWWSWVRVPPRPPQTSSIATSISDRRYRNQVPDPPLASNSVLVNSIQALPADRGATTLHPRGPLNPSTGDDPAAGSSLPPVAGMAPRSIRAGHVRLMRARECSVEDGTREPVRLRPGGFNLPAQCVGHTTRDGGDSSNLSAGSEFARGMVAGEIPARRNSHSPETLRAIPRKRKAPVALERGQGRKGSLT